MMLCLDRRAFLDRREPLGTPQHAFAQAAEDAQSWQSSTFSLQKVFLQTSGLTSRITDNRYDNCTVLEGAPQGLVQVFPSMRCLADCRLLKSLILTAQRF